VTLASGVGSMPGSEQSEYAEAVRIVLEELPDLAHVPELPGRGVTADLTGRGLAITTGLGVDLQPAGWRLTGAAGIDHRRARSLLAQDLDTVEELSQGYTGPFKIQVAGPWTLAATVEKPRGDKVLSDHGARRDLAQGLAEGLVSHIADVKRRVPGATELIVQLDEPSLPAVLAAQVPTASGFGRHRSVDPPRASEALEWVTSAVEAAGGVPVVHCCAAGFDIGLVRGAGARGVCVDVDLLDASAYDALAEAVDAGDRVFLGLLPTLESPVTEKSLTEKAVRLLDMLGLEPADNLVITPACGLAGASPAWARQALMLSRQTAANLTN
jgi:methionine synthase II (cobalamin-independent)